MKKIFRTMLITVLSFCLSCNTCLQEAEAFQVWDNIGWECTPDDIRSTIDETQSYNDLTFDADYIINVAPDESYNEFMGKLVGDTIAQNTSYISYFFESETGKLKQILVPMIFFSFEVDHVYDTICSNISRYYAIEPYERLEESDTYKETTFWELNADHTIIFVMLYRDIDYDGMQNVSSVVITFANNN